MAEANIPGTWEAKAGIFQIQSQLEQLGDTLSKIKG